MKEVQVENKLNRTQKTGFVLLFVFTILVVGLGALQMRNNIFNPLAVKLDAPANTLGISDENTKLQNLDTDQDGINDYEELFFYETSPYLPDTDSDGIGDKQELDAGTDPNCPEGGVCENYEVINTATSTQELSPIVGLGQSDPSSAQDINSLTTEELQQVLQSPEKVRDLILKTGKINKEQLDSIDDATLMNLVQNLLLTDGNLTQ